MIICPKCEINQDRDSFGRNKNRPDGRSLYCKSCMRKYWNDYRELHRKERREYHKFFSRTERGRASHKKASKKWVKKNNVERKAHAAVERAVKKGVLVPLAACECCESRGALDAHHDDYSKVLEVRWLCRPCHKNIHKIGTYSI